MVVNKNMALSVWNKKYGRKKLTCDFAGRLIEKTAFENKSSHYAWGLLPLGNEYVCCHLLTLEEKGRDFPQFWANKRLFEIQRKDSHLEIAEKFVPSFLDVKVGIKHWSHCLPEQQKYFVNYIKIQITKSYQMVEFFSAFRQFAEELFQIPVCFSKDCSELTFIDMDEKDPQEILDDCIILNTYAQHYFELHYGCKIQICCGRLEYGSKANVQLKLLANRLEQIKVPHEYALSIDENMKLQTKAKNVAQSPVLLAQSVNGFFPYNYTLTKLRKSLESIG